MYKITVETNNDDRIPIMRWALMATDIAIDEIMNRINERQKEFENSESRTLTTIEYLKAQMKDAWSLRKPFKTHNKLVRQLKKFEAA